MGFFLCLSIVMVVIAIVRSSRVSHGPDLNTLWQSLWQIVESCIALIMASITAFRSIFVSERHREHVQKRWAYSWRKRAKQRKLRRAIDAWEGDQLPSIPHATFTTMRRYLRSHRWTAEKNLPLDSETRPLERQDKTTLSV